MKDRYPKNVPSAFGICWYRPETYERCLATFQDSSDLAGSYDEWLVQAEALEQRRKSEGWKVVRVEIDPVAFPRWCADEGYSNIDRHARMAFANLTAMKSLRKSSR